jgi:hypothetical protein
VLESGDEEPERNEEVRQMAAAQIWTYRRVETDVDLTGYDVEAVDGSIGTIEDAMSEAGQNYLVVDTGPWIFGRRVLLPAGLVDRIDTADEKVFVDRSREEIKNAPEYDRERGPTDLYRERVGSYYAGRTSAGRGPEREAASTAGTRRRRSTSAPARGRSGTTRGQSSSARSRSTSSRGRSSSARSRSGSRRRTQARATDEPTRDELYEQAKQLGIDGRSKMNKTELKRAVSRRRGRTGSTQRTRSTSQRARSTSSQGRKRSTSRRAKANPVEVQAFLEGVSYPTRKGDLVREAERSGASRTVRSTLERLPEERFADPTEVSEAIGTLR